MSFFGYRTEEIIQINSSGFKILTQKGQLEEHSFADTIKLLPIYENGEVNFEVIGKGIQRRYKTAEAKQMVAVYIRAIDQYIESSPEKVFSSIKNQFLRFSFELRIANSREKSVYSVSAKLFRTHLKFFLISKRIH